jgi:glycine hydroxymethyltransferase
LSKFGRNVSKAVPRVHGMAARGMSQQMKGAEFTGYVAENPGYDQGVSFDVAMLNKPLPETDPELHAIIQDEKKRQADSLCMIASENLTSKSVLDALGSVMSNKYSEGYPGARYYGGNEHIDRVESLCQKRALEAFNLDPAKWGVNVQSLSGSPANFQVYTALLAPHDRIMALDLPHGGHLSHGYQTDTKKISAVSTYFESMPYQLDPATGNIDYVTLAKNAKLFRPKMLVAGASAFSLLIDYEKMRKVADDSKAYLLADMAHISGLVSAGVIPSPFDYADVVTTTTHKSLRGPRGAMIFYRKGLKGQDKKGNDIMYDLEDKINFAVFPGLQGGPHNHTIAALSTALLQAASPDFKNYQKQVMVNSAKLAGTLTSMGYDLVGGRTENHLCLVNVKSSKDIDGARVERVLELANISCNKNTVPGDVSAMTPSGIRLGACALTTRGMDEADMVKVAEFVDRAVHITKDIKVTTGPKLKDFKAALAGGANAFPALEALASEVAAFSNTFPNIGYD